MSTPNNPIDQFNQMLTAVTTTAETTIMPLLQEMLEQGTETVGRIVTPIAENPVVQFATRVPGVNWLMAALGQVNVEKVEREVAALRQQYPLETSGEIAQRIIADTAMKAAGAGLVTNVIPPAAISLLALDIAAVTALQADMVYRIAAVYGFSLHEPTRRGEVLAIWGLSTGGSGVLKTGLSLVEAIPLVGAGIGIASNAVLIYSLGQIAYRFYEAKQAALAKSAQSKPEDVVSHSDTPV
ncbi:EcsC family protein [Leptolyngbya sp. NK1-12]|uniref:EcsC family protein n=1 Tax=Leptolyngbya sp. NK1-12 TaxID=2547451 RepID=A0AA96WFX9_9CYAN|nr:EcsC family protein [Leptolyngbya sp. NK1-12]